jgi:hypothetical protein
MPEFLSQVESHDAVAIVFLSFAFVAGLVVWLSLQWRLHRRTDMEVALKHAMLERGLSVAEIERVLNATLGGGADSNCEAAVGRSHRPV